MKLCATNTISAIYEYTPLVTYLYINAFWISFLSWIGSYYSYFISVIYYSTMYVVLVRRKNTLSITRLVYRISDDCFANPTCTHILPIFYLDLVSISVESPSLRSNSSGLVIRWQCWPVRPPDVTSPHPRKTKIVAWGKYWFASGQHFWADEWACRLLISSICLHRLISDKRIPADWSRGGGNEWFPTVKIDRKACP